MKIIVAWAQVLWVPLRVVLGLFWVGVLSGCGADAASSGVCSSSYDALAVVSDYSSSEVGAISVDGGSSFRAGFDLGSDPAMAISDDRAFFIDRFGGNIFELKAPCGVPIAKWNGNVPNTAGTSNPQDVAVDPTTGDLWIAEFDVPMILVLSASGGVVRTIDLSSFAPPDGLGNPNASSISILCPSAGSMPCTPSAVPKAFVALERLDAQDMLSSNEPSTLLRLDVASGDVEAQLQLPGRNPFGVMEEEAGILWIAAPGSFSLTDEPDAGVVSVDPMTFTAQLVVTEGELGGSVVEVAVSGACGVAIVANAVPNVNATSLVTFDATTGAVLRSASSAILSTSGYYLQAMTWVGQDTLLVGEGSSSNSEDAPRVHVFKNPSDGGTPCDLSELSPPIPTPLKPIALRTVAD
jgi:hypothetical protein